MLSIQKGLDNLRSLDLTGNPVTEIKDYKEKVQDIFPNLEVLDGYDKDGKEVISEDEDEYGDEHDDYEEDEDAEEQEGQFGEVEGDDYDSEEANDDEYDEEEVYQIFIYVNIGRLR